MYTSHFHLQDDPFPPLSDSTAIFESKELREILVHFLYARENEQPLFLLTGEAGNGKSTAIRAIRRELPPGTPVAIISHSTLSPNELLEELAAQFGLMRAKRESKPRLLRRLTSALVRSLEAGKWPLLIVDEAHLLRDWVLEEVRLISNLRHRGKPLLQICLVGQPELLERLRQSGLRQLRQRITVRYALEPLGRQQTRDYLAERLRSAGSDRPAAIIDKAAADAVYELTGGIPREINVVAGQAMLNAYLEGAGTVTRKHVLSVRSNYGFEGIRIRSSRSPAAARSLPEASFAQPVETGGLRDEETQRLPWLRAHSARSLARRCEAVLARAAVAVRPSLTRGLEILGPAVATGKSSLIRGFERVQKPAFAAAKRKRRTILAAAGTTILVWVSLLAGRAVWERSSEDEPPGRIAASRNEFSVEASGVMFADPEPAAFPPSRVAVDPPAGAASSPEMSLAPAPRVGSAGRDASAAETAEPAQRPMSRAPARAGGSRSRYRSALKIESDVPAVVWLGEKKIGKAPGTFHSLPPGLYVLKLDAGDGRVLEKNVILTAGSTTYVHADSLAPSGKAGGKSEEAGRSPQAVAPAPIGVRGSSRSGSER